MTEETPPRPRILYRLALIPPPLVAVWFFAARRFDGYYASFRDGTAPTDAMNHRWLVNTLIWFAAIAPLLFLAYERGKHYVAARRQGTFLYRGLAEVVTRAFGREPTAEQLTQRNQPPRDRPLLALGLGVAVAVLVPALFAGTLSVMRTPPRIAWLIGAGVLMGATTYLNIRARAFLLEEAPLLSPLRGFQELSPSRYAEEGRLFARLRLLTILALPFWWLGVGAYVAF